MQGSSPSEVMDRWADPRLLEGLLHRRQEAGFIKTNKQTDCQLAKKQVDAYWAETSNEEILKM